MRVGKRISVLIVAKCNVNGEELKSLKEMKGVLIVAKCNVNILFIVLVLYPPIVLIEANCNTDISISNFKFLYIFLIIFSFFQLSGIIYKTQFTIGVEINENYKI